MQKTGIYNLGIIVSPGTGKLCLSMYVPVFDTDGKTPIGYVGAGVFNDQLDTILKKIRFRSDQKPILHDQHRNQRLIILIRIRKLLPKKQLIPSF